MTSTLAQPLAEPNFGTALLGIAIAAGIVWTIIQLKDRIVDWLEEVDEPEPVRIPSAQVISDLEHEYYRCLAADQARFYRAARDITNGPRP